MVLQAGRQPHVEEVPSTQQRQCLSAPCMDEISGRLALQIHGLGVSPETQSRLRQAQSLEGP